MVAMAVPVVGVEKPAGERAAAAWLAARGLYAPVRDRWHVAIALDCVGRRAGSETRLEVTINPNEWGFVFCHGSGTSWIRVADGPEVHDRDDFELLPNVPVLRNLGS